MLQRRRLEEEKGDANEVVLTNESGEDRSCCFSKETATLNTSENKFAPSPTQGHAIEGTQTNFYVIKNGAVHTAPPGEVLVGTIRVIVQRMCEREGIPFMEYSSCAR